MKIVKIGGSNCVSGTEDPPTIELQDCIGDVTSIVVTAVNGGPDAATIALGDNRYQVFAPNPGPYIVRAVCCAND